MRNIIRSLAIFVMGAFAALLFDAHFPPAGRSTTMLWAVTLIAVLVFFGSSWQEIRQWLHLRRQLQVKYGPLTVDQILSLHEILASDSGGGKWFVRMLPSDRHRPPIHVGKSIWAVGKTASPMNSGYTELVGCRVRLATGKPPERKRTPSEMVQQ